jgi:hypothetical protein
MKPIFKTKDILKFLDIADDKCDYDQGAVKEIARGLRVLVGQEHGPFISGWGGDVNGVPEVFHVCYHLGADCSGVYKLVQTTEQRKKSLEDKYDADMMEAADEH